MSEARITVRTRTAGRNVCSRGRRRWRLATHGPWVTILVRRHMLPGAEGLRRHVLPRAEGRGRHDPARTKVGSWAESSRRHDLSRAKATRTRSRGRTAGREALWLRSDGRR